MKAFGFILVAGILLALGIWLTFVFLKSQTYIAIPFLWIIVMAGWGEAGNVLLRKRK